MRSSLVGVIALTLAFFSDDTARAAPGDPYTSFSGDGVQTLDLGSNDIGDACPNVAAATAHGCPPAAPVDPFPLPPIPTPPSPPGVTGTGTAGPDVFAGTVGRDVFRARAGNDRLRGGPAGDPPAWRGGQRPGRRRGGG